MQKKDVYVLIYVTCVIIQLSLHHEWYPHLSAVSNYLNRGSVHFN